MDKIHDKASKFLKDVCKKKITVGNKTSHDVSSEQNKKTHHSLPNSCCYCHKVFLTPEVLLKHIHRRHSDELILFHKKMLTILNSESDYNSKSLMSYFEGHFSVLYNELISMKKVIIPNRSGDFLDSCKENEGSECSVEKRSEISLNVLEASTSADKANDICREKFSGEVGHLRIKIEDVEGKVECLSNKFEEIFKTLNNEISLRQEFYKQITEKEAGNQKTQERMFFELRSNLLQDFQIMLCSKLQDKDDDFKFQISDLKEAVEKLDCLVDLNTKQINSPDYLTAIEKKLEKHVFYLLGNSNRTKKKMSQSRCSRADNLSSTNYSKSLNRKRVKRNVLEGNGSKNDIVAHQISRTEQNGNDCITSTESYVTRNEISFLVAEKMAGLNINPHSTKISSSEYHDKVQLINAHKEQLCEKYQCFEEIYNKINTHAEQMAFSRLKNKKSRKLRFSEPLTLNKNIACDQKHKDFQNRTYPSQLCENKHFSFSPQKNGNKKFIDLSASGDCSWNFSQLKHNSKKQLESSSVEEMEYTNPIAINSDNQERKPINSNINNAPNISESINVTKISYSSEEVLENLNSDPANLVTSQKSSPLKLNASNSKINEKDDFDDVSSLESLSSWDDKENPHF